LELDRDVQGVVITEVDPSGAAASAGLQEGDVIQQINGRAVRSAEQVRSGLDAAAADKPVVLLVARGGGSLFVPLRAPRG
jgi:serine protease Do